MNEMSISVVANARMGYFFLIKYNPKLVNNFGAIKTVAKLSLLLRYVYEKFGGCAPGTSSSFKFLSYPYLRHII